MRLALLLLVLVAGWVVAGCASDDSAGSNVIVKDGPLPAKLRRSSAGGGPPSAGSTGSPARASSAAPPIHH
ncbi:MAG TPA: hypothetical protein VG944_00470 [Fimbriimonas sp.]|nr:hypothetical protein [Fimbriimonas sp.]